MSNPDCPKCGLSLKRLIKPEQGAEPFYFCNICAKSYPISDIDQNSLQARVERLEILVRKQGIELTVLEDKTRSLRQGRGGGLF